MPRIAFLAANPAETTRLALDIEMREVKAALNRGTFRTHFTIDFHPAIQIDAVQEVIDQTRPDIVHFAGHGSESREELVLMDGDNHARTVDVDKMAQILERCEGVVLNACCSARQAEAIAARGPWAIGTSAPIKSSEAITFSRMLYAKLANGCELEDAFRGAALQLGFECRAGSEKLPQLFLGVRGNRLWTAYPLINGLIALRARLARSNVEIRTFHRLLLIHEIAPSYFEAVVETARAGAARKVLDWLHYLEQTQGIAQSKDTVLRDEEDSFLGLARERAQRAGRLEVDARDYLCALLGDSRGNVIAALRKQLEKAAPGGFSRLVAAAEQHVPQPYALRSEISSFDL